MTATMTATIHATINAKPKTLHIARKLLSLLGKIEVTDDDNVVYEASAQWSWFIRPWRITQNGRELAVVRRKLRTDLARAAHRHPRLKKMYAEERRKTEVVAEALASHRPRFSIRYRSRGKLRNMDSHGKAPMMWAIATTKTLSAANAST